MKVAKHLQIAASQGAQAGLDAYISVPISARQPAYQEIQKKRTPDTKLAAYCKAFGIKNTPVTASPVVDDLAAQIAALQAQIAGVSAPVVEDPIEALKRQVTELQAQIANGTATDSKPTFARPRPWDLNGKEVGKDGTFVHITKGDAKRASQRITYKALSFDEAVEALTACYENNVRYCVRVSS